MTHQKLILSSPLLEIMISRLCQQLIENHGDFHNSVAMGLQPRGVYFAERVVAELRRTTGIAVPLGYLDATFYRDDFRRGDILTPNQNKIDFVIEKKRVILIDDVLATGRMVRAAIDAMQAFGRPSKIELMVLIDRQYNREIPVEADYIGLKVNTLESQRVKVELREQGHEADKIWLVD
ncbi:MAG: bifunctional pyr operon transcriptional regulator/uracil phosphoribosyltransferase PyrR [Runella slithyformis]|jgi:pyrimidine operon attenuation protein / uracil phosphoribosyltransferase|nr:MAG: bifunctional pyr operon transcriptional regulator/uracil phosphoribosyltransferase PyrR [Runella slithyformis]TAE99747.1 MAG: bifunctional pyr operon transcriptional regulator/uracil phosphoribosyltransferase PyrR [Runella slithyformis]TAF24780.1 MAG: bifunctional pyr operon transcriptional regulator/uracil phosphoribosyltransferase PyrR [Runella slithyformis]TAF49609.1 MAG: bifunctional pyr operon transcriptional regulator/uracil phosphoribosyltransferase PyrR [Runella slithyformis]TAF